MKTTIGTIIVFILIILGLYFLYTSETVKNYLNKTANDALEKAPNEIVKNLEFEPFTEYLRSDLTDEEKEQLRSILADRRNKLSEIDGILSEEFEKTDADMGVAFIKVAEIRESIKKSLLPFIDQNKMQDFEEKYAELGRDIESRYVTK